MTAVRQTYIERLIDFVFDCKRDQIPADVVEQFSLLLLDSLGVALANHRKLFVQAYAKTVTASVAHGSCTAVGFDTMWVAEGAAALNSTAMHGNDFDATHLPSIMHPCAVILPVTLAVAEETGASGADFLAASIAGFELLIRMGLATGGAMHRGGFQSTALCAPVISTMVAARLYGMEREQAADAAGLAASIAAGLRAFSDDGTWGKRIITGWACRAALTSAALAREGYPGSHNALEKKPFGFYQAFVPGGEYDLSQLTRRLGEHWETCEVDLKRYPCSHGHHAFINTARRAKEALRLAPANITSVAVHASAEAAKWWFEPKALKYELPDIYGARFSLPYTVAIALVFGNLTDELMESREFLDDERVRALVPKVVPKIDPTLQNENPNRLPGSLEITTIDGRTTKFDGTGAPAGTELEAAVLEKFHLNTGQALSAKAAAELIALTTQIVQQSEIRSMMRMLRP